MNNYEIKLLKLLSDKKAETMTFEDMAKAIGAKYTSHVNFHLGRLIQMGYVQKEGKKYVLNPEMKSDSDKFWLMAVVSPITHRDAESLAAGKVDSFIRVSTAFAKPNAGFFALRVEDDSLSSVKVNGVNMEAGDYVIVASKKHDPKNGDCVISVFDGLASIKIFHRDKKTGQVALLSKTEEQYLPIFIHQDDFLSKYIAGTIVGVIKNPKI